MRCLNIHLYICIDVFARYGISSNPPLILVWSDTKCASLLTIRANQLIYIYIYLLFFYFHSVGYLCGYVWNMVKTVSTWLSRASRRPSGLLFHDFPRHCWLPRTRLKDLVSPGSGINCLKNVQQLHLYLMGLEQVVSVTTESWNGAQSCWKDIYYKTHFITHDRLLIMIS